MQVEIKGGDWYMSNKQERANKAVDVIITDHKKNYINCVHLVGVWNAAEEIHDEIDKQPWKEPKKLFLHESVNNRVREHIDAVDADYRKDPAIKARAGAYLAAKDAYEGFQMPSRYGEFKLDE